MHKKQQKIGVLYVTGRITSIEGSTEPYCLPILTGGFMAVVQGKNSRKDYSGMKYIERICETLIRQWEYDIAVMSQPWMYWYLVPILLYVAFFFLKWAVLTAPAWLPFALIIQSFRK
jgi:hypothetical protein